MYRSYMSNFVQSLCGSTTMTVSWHRVAKRYPGVDFFFDIFEQNNSQYYVKNCNWVIILERFLCKTCPVMKNMYTKVHKVCYVGISYASHTFYHFWELDFNVSFRKHKFSMLHCANFCVYVHLKMKCWLVQSVLFSFILNRVQFVKSFASGNGVKILSAELSC
jgi:hypothetical protein